MFLLHHWNKPINHYIFELLLNRRSSFELCSTIHIYYLSNIYCFIVTPSSSQSFYATLSLCSFYDTAVTDFVVNYNPAHTYCSTQTGWNGGILSSLSKLFIFCVFLKHKYDILVKYAHLLSCQEFKDQYHAQVCFLNITPQLEDRA